MATIAFYAAGAAIGAATMGTGTVAMGLTGAQIGGMVGGMIGGVVDSQIIMPMIFGTGGAFGPRLDNLMVQSATEGSPICQCWGKECTMAGVVAWSRDLIETEVDSSEKGGMGGGGGGSSFVYYANTATIICRNPIEKVLKVWANAKLIYDGTITDTTFTNNNFTAHYTPAGYGLPAMLRFLCPTGTNPLIEGIKLSKVNNVVVSGFATAANNGSFNVIRRIINDNGWDIIEVKAPVGAATEAAGATVTFFQVATQWEAGYEDLTIYLGTLSQTPDPTYEANVGAGNAAAFRGHSYIVIKNLNVSNSDYGNHPPSLRFLVCESSTRTVGEAIGMILEDHDMDPSEYDVSALTMELSGYVVQGPTTGIQKLEPLMLAYNIGCQERDGKLIFFLRTSSVLITIDDADLACYEETQNTDRPIQLYDGPTYSLPAELNVNFIDPEIDWQKGSQPFRKTAYISNNSQSIDMPLTLDKDQARSIAKRLLISNWAENRKASLRLPPSYLHVQEGDHVAASMGGQTYVIRVSDLTRGVNFITEISGEVVQTQTHTVTASSETGNSSTTPPYVAPTCATVVLDIPALLSSDATTPGAYYGTFAMDYEATWQGATMYISTNDLDFSLVGDVSAELTGGICETTLGTAAHGYWDNINTLEVQLRNGVLETKTEIDVLNGANVVVVGDEILAFCTATVIGTNRYRISKLLRGMRGTERFIGTHAAEEIFVLLSGSSIKFRPLELASLGTQRYWRAVAADAAIASVDSFAPAWNANSVRSFAPCHVELTRDASNNLTFTWQRRSRAIFRHFSGATAPMLESVEQYEVDVTVGSLTVTLRVIGATTVTYTAAEQTADGFTPADPKDVILYQTDPTIGRGFPTQEFTV